MNFRYETSSNCNKHHNSHGYFYRRSESGNLIYLQKSWPGLVITKDILTAMGKWNYSNFKGTIQKMYIHWPWWQIYQNEERLPKEDYFPLARQLYLHCNIIFTKMNIGCLLLNRKANTKLFKLNIVRLYLDAKCLEKTFHWKLLELIGWDVGQTICRYCRFS